LTRENPAHRAQWASWAVSQTDPHLFIHTHTPPIHAHMHAHTCTHTPTYLCWNFEDKESRLYMHMYEGMPGMCTWRYSGVYVHEGR
jgi:hypothetical protein